MAHIIVIGNEKGGAGKSTVALHVATALARMQHKVGVIDLDLRQRSVARYVENRQAYASEAGLILPLPQVYPLPDTVDPNDAAHPQDQRLEAAIRQAAAQSDFVVIDCPGSHTRLAEGAHARADTLVTPMNDSFVDFDLLAQIASDGVTVKGPSVYSEMVWKARQMRAQAGAKPIDWVVLRNRLGTQAMINKRKLEAALEVLAPRIGFRIAPGFSERVVFRELFPRGLTLMDLGDAGIRQWSVSNIAARQEVRDMLRALGLPGVTVTV